MMQTIVMDIFSIFPSNFRKYIEVHGRPTSAVFHSKEMVPGKTSYELSWEVESFVSIQEYRLLYRRIDMVSGEGNQTKKLSFDTKDKSF